MQTPRTSFLENVLTIPVPERFISFMYETFDVNSAYSSEHIRMQWQIDLGCQIEDETWTSIIGNTLSILSCNNDRERQFKILHRLHYTPLLRSKLGLSSPNCNKCGTEVGTYAHVFLEMYKDSAVLGRGEKRIEHLVRIPFGLVASPLYAGCQSNQCKEQS